MRVAASLIVLMLTTLAGAADGDRVATIDGRELVGRVVTVDTQAVRIATADGFFERLYITKLCRVNIENVLGRRF